MGMLCYSCDDRVPLFAPSLQGENEAFKGFKISWCWKDLQKGKKRRVISAFAASCVELIDSGLLLSVVNSVL